MKYPTGKQRREFVDSVDPLVELMDGWILKWIYMDGFWMLHFEKQTQFIYLVPRGGKTLPISVRAINAICWREKFGDQNF